jgi:serine/threonine protein kinase
MNLEGIETTFSSSTHTLGRWTLIKQLGSGATSRVYLAIDPQTREKLAIKIFTIDTKTSHQLLEVESYILKSIDHSNIIHFLEANEAVGYHDPVTGCVKTVAALVMEYAPNGELFDLVEKQGHFSEELSRSYFRQLISALAYLHCKGVAHRDIKLENLLLDSRNNLKLADFGYSGRISSGKMFQHAAGTSAYFAPEIHAGKPHSGEAADLFAAGIILFAIMTGHMPFASAQPKDRIYNLVMQNDFKTFWLFHEKMTRKKFPDVSLSSEFKDLMSKMFEPNPSERANLEDILSHPWVLGKGQSLSSWLIQGR